VIFAQVLDSVLDLHGLLQLDTDFGATFSRGDIAEDFNRDWNLNKLKRLGRINATLDRCIIIKFAPRKVQLERILDGVRSSETSSRFFDLLVRSGSVLSVE